MKIFLPNKLTCAVVLCLAAVFSSCLPDGGYEQLFPQTELGIAHYTSDSNSWYILNDANFKLWPKNAESIEKPADNARVLVGFNVLSGDRMPGYDYVVAVAYMANVNVYDVTPTSADKMSSDTLRNVDFAWIGSHYLNVDYYFFHGVAPEKHEVSLLRDTTALQDEEIKLFLKHDGNGDKGAKPRQNIVSFDLESLRDVVQTDSVNITFEAECADGLYQRSFAYKFKN
jgi:hypothetical protein